MTLGDILELIHQMLTDGITWATLISVFLVIHKMIEGNRKRAAYERLEHKVDAILEKEGIMWDARKSGSISYPMKLRNFIVSYWVIPFHVGIVRLFINWRAIKMPQVNRFWLFSIIVFIGGMISKRMGIEFSEAIYNEVTDFIVYIVLPLAGFALDKFKKPSQTTPTESNK